MAVKGASVAYCAVGGLVLFSGIKGATIAATVTALLHGNLSVSDTETIAFGSSGASGNGSASGSAILADAEQYAGHKYVYGGPSNPTSGWDCSSFVSCVLGKDMGFPIPGGSWAAVTSNGASHGPTADEYLTWSGATTVATSAAQPGDLLVWDTHIGFVVDSSHMFSAYDTASGTLETGWTGPNGEGQPTVRSVNGATASSGSTGSFASAVLSGIGAPSSSANTTSMNNWFKQEGTAAQNNPMATTQPESGSTAFNSAGVQNYPSQATGVQATVATLENGDYPAILMALRAGQGLNAGNAQVESELMTWSGGGYNHV